MDCLNEIWNKNLLFFSNSELDVSSDVSVSALALRISIYTQFDFSILKYPSNMIVFSIFRNILVRNYGVDHVRVPALLRCTRSACVLQPLCRTRVLGVHNCISVVVTTRTEHHDRLPCTCSANIRLVVTSILMLYSKRTHTHIYYVYASKHSIFWSVCGWPQRIISVCDNRVVTALKNGGNSYLLIFFGFIIFTRSK